MEEEARVERAAKERMGMAKHGGPTHNCFRFGEGVFQRAGRARQQTRGNSWHTKIMTANSSLQVAAGYRVHAVGGEIVRRRRREAANLRRAARRRERAIGRGGLVISTEMSAAKERSQAAAGLEGVAAKPAYCRNLSRPL